MRLSMDIFGNKCLVVSGRDIGMKRGFSVQTNGNLPLTHTMPLDALDQEIAWDELVIFIKQHGSASHRVKMGV